MVNSIICYQCTDCPEPFYSNYPYVTLVNNTNFLSQCTVSFILLLEKKQLKLNIFIYLFNISRKLL